MSINILIVDDEVAISRILQVYLNQLGADCTVLSAVNGENALEIIEGMNTDEYPKLTLLDVMMKGMGGIETAKKLLEIGLENIYIFTAYLDMISKEQAITIGATGFMKKSEGFRHIAEKIAAIISKE